MVSTSYWLMGDLEYNKHLWRCPWCNGYRRRMWTRRHYDTTTRVQILDEPDYISHNTNSLGKGMNPNIRPPAMGK